jgi:fucose permease
MTCPFLVTALQSKQHIQAFLLLSAGTVGVLTVALIVAPIHIPEQDAHSAQLGSRLRYLCTPTAVLLGALFFAYIGTEISFGFWLASYAKRAGNAEGMWWATVPSTFIAHCSSVALLLR